MSGERKDTGNNGNESAQKGFVPWARRLLRRRDPNNRASKKIVYTYFFKW